MTPGRYNIRVYGICVVAQGQGLITDERRGNLLMTKFPGGGHHFGEGLADALRREFREEADCAVDIHGLFYANDFLQISAFNPRDQLISLYYLVSLAGELPVAVKHLPYDFAQADGDEQIFRWVAIADLAAADFRFPIDKIVVGKLLENRVEITRLMYYHYLAHK